MHEVVKRIAPSHGFMLECEQFGGGKFSKGFRLCFDFSAFARIKERTGIELWNEPRNWASLDSSSVLPVVFWAAILRHHPEYASDDGLEAVASYIDPSNADKIGMALFEAYLVSLPKEMAQRLRDLLDSHKKGASQPDPNPAPEASPEVPSA